MTCRWLSLPEMFSSAAGGPLVFNRAAGLREAWARKRANAGATAQTRASALAHCAKALRASLTTHWSLSAALGYHMPSLRDAVDAGRLPGIGRHLIDEEEELLIVGNPARHAPPPGNYDAAIFVPHDVAVLEALGVKGSAEEWRIFVEYVHSAEDNSDLGKQGVISTAPDAKQELEGVQIAPQEITAAESRMIHVPAVTVGLAKETDQKEYAAEYVELQAENGPHTDTEIVQNVNVVNQELEGEAVAPKEFTDVESLKIPVLAATVGLETEMELPQTAANNKFEMEFTEAERNKRRSTMIGRGGLVACSFRSYSTEWVNQVAALGPVSSRQSYSTGEGSLRSYSTEWVDQVAALGPVNSRQSYSTGEGWIRGPQGPRAGHGSAARAEVQGEGEGRLPRGEPRGAMAPRWLPAAVLLATWRPVLSRAALPPAPIVVAEGSCGYPACAKHKIACQTKKVGTCVMPEPGCLNKNAVCSLGRCNCPDFYCAVPGTKECVPQLVYEGARPGAFARGPWLRAFTWLGSPDQFPSLAQLAEHPEGLISPRCLPAVLLLFVGLAIAVVTGGAAFVDRPPPGTVSPSDGFVPPEAARGPQSVQAWGCHMVIAFYQVRSFLGEGCRAPTPCDLRFAGVDLCEDLVRCVFCKRAFRESDVPGETHQKDNITLAVPPPFFGKDKAAAVVVFSIAAVLGRLYNWQITSGILITQLDLGDRLKGNAQMLQSNSVVLNYPSLRGPSACLSFDGSPDPPGSTKTIDEHRLSFAPSILPTVAHQHADIAPDVQVGHYLMARARDDGGARPPCWDGLADEAGVRPWSDLPPGRVTGLVEEVHTGLHLCARIGAKWLTVWDGTDSTHLAWITRGGRPATTTDGTPAPGGNTMQFGRANVSSDAYCVPLSAPTLRSARCQAAGEGMWGAGVAPHWRHTPADSRRGGVEDPAYRRRCPHSEMFAPHSEMFAHQSCAMLQLRGMSMIGGLAVNSTYDLATSVSNFRSELETVPRKIDSIELEIRSFQAGDGDEEGTAVYLPCAPMLLMSLIAAGMLAEVLLTRYYGSAKTAKYEEKGLAVCAGVFVLIIAVVAVTCAALLSGVIGVAQQCDDIDQNLVEYLQHETRHSNLDPIFMNITRHYLLDDVYNPLGQFADEIFTYVETVEELVDEYNQSIVYPQSLSCKPLNDLNVNHIGRVTKETLAVARDLFNATNVYPYYQEIVHNGVCNHMPRSLGLFCLQQVVAPMLFRMSSCPRND
ncbi:unnamed protein product [Prorocentrum cordatum]|uniref:Uncharacterized protein n=1 Tax=Prorocentrum cordatum TaxID=2364126 RepID=A0ABN9UY73_9DINO|nr:unnamed protein product [Polarella glacialis]